MTYRSQDRTYEAFGRWMTYELLNSFKDSRVVTIVYLKIARSTTNLLSLELVLWQEFCATCGCVFKQDNPLSIVTRAASIPSSSGNISRAD